jgi:hypothetical protein
MKYQMILCALVVASFSGGLAAISSDSRAQVVAFLVVALVAGGYIETLA